MIPFRRCEPARQRSSMRTVKVFPMKREVFERRFPVVPRQARDRRMSVEESDTLVCCCDAPDMGLAPGGRMRQEIYDDEFELDDWDAAHARRCFVHLMNSLVWRSVPMRRPDGALLTERC